MRPAVVLAVALLPAAILMATVAAAQDPRFTELDRQVSQLYSQGKYEEGIPLAQELLTKEEEALGPDNLEVARTLNSLAVLYKMQGRYREAEPLYNRALEIRRRTLGLEDTLVAQSLNNLAVLYHSQGRYAEAEPLLKQALAIREKTLGPEHPSVAVSLDNLAVLYQAQGRNEESEPLCKRALAIWEKTDGVESVNVASALLTLSSLAEIQHRYKEAEALDRRALAIREKALGPEHPAVANVLVALALPVWAQKRYDEAEVLYEHAITIQEKALGSEHPALANTLNHLVVMYIYQNRYRDAEPLIRRALAIREKTLGPEHPDVDDSVVNLACVEFALERPDVAEPLFKRALDIVHHRFEYSFTYMDEKERLQFLVTVSNYFSLYLSFCTRYARQMPELVGGMYDVLLWEKGIVAQSMTALRAKIASDDPEAVNLLEQLTLLKAQISASGRSRNGQDFSQKHMADLLAQATGVEEKLVRRSASLQQDKKLERITWREVQEVLRRGDVAVEVAKFRYSDGKKWEDHDRYVALIVTPETKDAPKLILIDEANQLDGDSFSAYRAEVQSRGMKAVPTAQAGPPPWRGLYDAVWRPLETVLGGANRIYLSPDGAVNEIPLGVLQAPDGRRVMERYDVRLVSSTKDLLRPRPDAGRNTAVVVGNPLFFLSDDEERTALSQLGVADEKQHQGLMASATPRLEPGKVLARDASARGACNPQPPAGGVLCPLPGTAKEIRSVGELLRGKQWVVATYQGPQALEEVVKRAASPRVLHLATHGFFLADQEVKHDETLNARLPLLDDPMLRSGLFFAGADRTLRDEPSTAGAENGVLTAYEATALNLKATELVVLSACETARGKIQNGEGVFGLRRAFQEAGAQAVLMSLWSVPDRETQELMTLFYKNWLAGAEKPEALRRAQLAERELVKKRYEKDQPFYWGAFVLVSR